MYPADLQEDTRFALLGAPKRVWAVSAINAEKDRLMDLHDALYERVQPDDRIVYLGNYIGFGPEPVETVNELLAFRRALLARDGMMADDFIYLRGRHEEMWQKLLQIQFAPQPEKVLLWLLDHGMAVTLESYGFDPREGLAAARSGVLALTRWTAHIRQTVRRHPGHDIFAAHWRRAAFTRQDGAAPLLFVHAGLDPLQPLHKQGDAFWWNAGDFDSINIPYTPFYKVIRGFDPAQNGLRINNVTITLDNGCGNGGSLVCAGFDDQGGVLEVLEI